MHFLKGIKTHRHHADERIYDPILIHAELYYVADFFPGRHARFQLQKTLNMEWRRKARHGVNAQDTIFAIT